MPGETRTAAQAAAARGCVEDQIAKSIIFWGESSDTGVLFITAGGRQVDHAIAQVLAGERLGRASADQVRAQTGFAIGGVAPIAHLSETRSFFDKSLMRFETVWAAAGTPRHVFEIETKTLLDLSGATLAEFGA